MIAPWKTQPQKSVSEKIAEREKKTLSRLLVRVYLVFSLCYIDNYKQTILFSHFYSFLQFPNGKDGT